MRTLVVPANVSPDAEIGLAAVGFLLLVTATLLVVGWATRARSVLWLAITFSLLTAAVGGFWAAMSLLPAVPGADRDFLSALFRIATFFWLVLLAVTIARLRSLPKPQPSLRPGPADRGYDRDWLLSLLQAKAAGRTESLATTSPREPAAASTPSADPTAKPSLD